MNQNYPLYLANRAVHTGQLHEVTDKFSGAVAAKVALAGAEEVERAIAAAAAAAPAMRRLPADRRYAVLMHCVQSFEARREELALALCVEAGKPITDARGEVTRLIETFRIAAEEALRPQGENINLALSERSRALRGITQRVPIGPCSFITPFNFPLNLVAHKVAPAIAAGCPFVLKPADKTPIGALLVGEVLAQTELPEGAFSILPLRSADAAPLVEDPRLKLLSFTGGPIGWELRARAGKKKVTLELGGNAACVIDADQGPQLERIVERLVFGAFYQSGQSCISVQRILVHESLYDALKSRLVEKVEALVHGDPRDERTFIGPVIDEASAIRITRWIDEASAQGAKVLCGGTCEGAMVRATLLEDVPTESAIYRKEVFGPVALLQRFSSFEQALSAVNDSDFGLQAGIFTDRLSHTLRAWDELEVGGVVIGDVPSVRVDNMPYGGVKDSGVGREGVRYAIEDMTEPRLLVINDLR